MSQLPPGVRDWATERASQVPFARLKTAAGKLSDEYRAGGGTATSGLSEEERTAAYLAVRFPATYAAALAVLTECSRRLPSIGSVLDLGAGCGTATLAALEVFPDLSSCTLIEMDKALSSAGREIVPQADWRRERLEEAAGFPDADLVVASYSLSELTGKARDGVIQKAWKAARIALVVIEPGSPAGFQVVRKIREDLLASGAHMAAPCPNGLPCPVPANDWCHFGARLERSALHRRLKDGGLSYEDEKFSYVALAKTPCELAAGRIIRRPTHAPGVIELTLCTDGRVDHRNIPKRDKEAFREARKASWGDAFGQRK